MKEEKILGVILGGGKGTRLYPLTKERSKPAVPFGGNYRIIDIPISNCINSGINKIFVMTQFHSASLNNHIAQTYRFDVFHEGFVNILASELTLDEKQGGFSQGTADAIRKAIKHLKRIDSRYILILSGDQLYRMDFGKLFEELLEKKASLAIGVIPIDNEDISRFGIVSAKDGYIVDFYEKPESLEILSSKDFVQYEDRYLASMGIYLFEKELLFKELLMNSDMLDFGKEFIPYFLKKYPVTYVVHKNYWEDIGSIRSYYEANLSLTSQNAPFQLYDPEHVFFTNPRFLPPSQVFSAEISESLLAPGSRLYTARVEKSVVGVRSIIHENTVIQNSIIMGHDMYEDGLEIGKNCVIKNAIIDKNVSIGDNVRIINVSAKDNYHSDVYSVVDGIVVIHKGVKIPDGTIL